MFECNSTYIILLILLVHIAISRFLKFIWFYWRIMQTNECIIQLLSELKGGGGYRLNFQISLFCDTFYFNKL